MQESDPQDNLESVSHENYQVGKILLFFAKIITFQINQWYSKTIDVFVEKFGKYPSTANDHVKIEMAMKKASKLLGKLFEANEKFPTSFLDDDDLTRFIVKEAKKNCSENTASIDAIAKYIKSALDDPSVAIKFKVPLKQTKTPVVQAMKRCLESMPFIFVLDEADELHQIQEGRMNGFENLQRAISYLRPRTKLFFLALGTKSIAHNLKPPVRDNSARDVIRFKLPAPIVLLSDSSVFSQEVFPLKDVRSSGAIEKQEKGIKRKTNAGHKRQTKKHRPSFTVKKTKKQPQEDVKNEKDPMSDLDDE